MPTVSDKHWHLAESDYEVELNDFAHSITWGSASFERWPTDVGCVLNLVADMYDQISCIGAAERISS